MANEVSEFESFLTGDAAHKYNSKRFGLRWLVVEVRSRVPVLSTQLRADMIHFEQLRAAVAATLARDPNDQQKSAAKWASFLKPRIEMLDFWASLIGAIGALLVGGCALLAALNSHEKSASCAFQRSWTPISA